MEINVNWVQFRNILSTCNNFLGIHSNPMNVFEERSLLLFLSFGRESRFSFPQFVPLGYILVRLDAVKKGLLAAASPLPI